MDFVNYINLLVHITLLDNFYYIGKVISADEDGLKILDKTGKNVFISNKSVATIREVGN